MNSMQRQFGKLLSTKGPGANARVSVLLNDFEDADKVLAQIIDNTKLWRDSWNTLLVSQHLAITQYQELYDPIQGASNGHGREMVDTPELQLKRTFDLRGVYESLKKEIGDEVTQIDARILNPATEARDYIDPVKKTIKKRENKRLAYEKSMDKMVKLQKKIGKTPKEESALAKAEAEVERLQEDFLAADGHLREALPPIIESTFNLVPLLVEAIVLVQNTLLGLYYTYLNQYCEEHDFPSPPPPMDDVIAVWAAAFKPSKSQVESITLIARGKGMRMPLNIGDEKSPSNSSATQSSTPSFSLKNGFRRSSTQPRRGEDEDPDASEPAPPAPPRPMRIPSFNSVAPPISSSRPEPSSRPSPRISPQPGSQESHVAFVPDYSGPQGYLTPTAFTTASNLGQTSSQSHQSAGHSRNDYFSRTSSTSTIASSHSAAAAIAAVKKKPPPPPPKRSGLGSKDQYMIALYDFAGQGSGDLSFREGDRIKVVKKTDSTQDWWTGDLNGVRGSFPANYCRAD